MIILNNDVKNEPHKGSFFYLFNLKIRCLFFIDPALFADEYFSDHHLLY